MNDSPFAALETLKDQPEIDGEESAPHDVEDWKQPKRRGAKRN